MSQRRMVLQRVFSDFLPSTASPLFADPSGELLYHQRGIGFYVDEESVDRAESYSLVVRYADDRISYANVDYHSGEGVGPEPRANTLKTPATGIAGYTLCATGRERHAVFEIGSLSFLHGQIGGADITVHGIGSIIECELIAGQCEECVLLARDQRVTREEAAPEFATGRALQLITTVGADQPFAEDLPKSLDTMKDLCPYVRKLGFNGVESYVKWNFVESRQGIFDWSYYDAVIALAAEYDLKWFPLIIGGSAYALPEWYHDMTGFTGFKCLEHGVPNNVPTIFNEHQVPYVSRYLHEFGRHYEGNKNVYGVRLGPSGNYGESQYPAGGNWGYKGIREHMHLGWWAGDEDASVAFRKWLRDKYEDIAALNAAWHEDSPSFESIKTYSPHTCLSHRKRKDFVDWYMHEMTDWCERWAVWMREELKSHDVYQSAGGWGYVECGTDFTDQTKSMVKINGGIRATNEDESYELNFAITRMISSAARFYGVPFGSEPAGFGLARSLMSRLFNIIVNNGQHLFYYHPGFAMCDLGEERWLKYARLLDKRDYPFIEVAVMYPDTLSKIDDSSIRYLDGSAFFSQVYSLRRELDFDYCSERMVMDGYLDSIKVLIFLSRNHSGDFVESEVLEKIDAWVASGGIVIYPVIKSNAIAGPGTIEGDYSVYNKWQCGQVGNGQVILIDAIREPLDDYIADIVLALKGMDTLDPLTQTMLSIVKPSCVYASVLRNRSIVLYNNGPAESVVEIENHSSVLMEAISISIVETT